MGTGTEDAPSLPLPRRLGEGKSTSPAGQDRHASLPTSVSPPPVAPGGAGRGHLVVDSVTGVEVALPVAGPGVRAYAFVIDWHIRAILAAAWYVIAMMFYNRDIANITPPLETDSMWFGLVALPAAAIYFLYHPVLEI